MGPNHAGLASFTNAGASSWPPCGAILTSVETTVTSGNRPSSASADLEPAPQHPFFPDSISRSTSSEYGLCSVFSEA